MIRQQQGALAGGKRWLRVPRAPWAPEEQAGSRAAAAAALQLSDLFGELEPHQRCTNKGIRKQTASPGLQSCSLWV